MADPFAHDHLQRSKRIELIISPNKSLGPFRLGSSLWDVILFLRERNQFFPTVELKYSQDNPLTTDFIVALPANGLHLWFDGSLQRLKSIECFDPSRVKLVYQNSDVSSSRTIPTFLLIYKSFGPTYPGEFNAANGTYTLKYPGVSFLFNIPTRYRDLYTSSSELPIEFPDGTTPSASRLYLYHGNTDWEKAALPPLSKMIGEHNVDVSIKYGKHGRRELENVDVYPTKGASLYFPSLNPENSGSGRDTTSTPAVSTVQLLLHQTSAQDIVADLGKPSRVYYKEEDKMKIHSVANEGDATEISAEKTERDDAHRATPAATEDDEKVDSVMTVQPTDYFFNYFHLGLDILLDGGLHVCKKIILHGNVPGHFDFQRYKRCPFRLLFADSNSDDANVLVDVDQDHGSKVRVITADMKISEMQHLIPWKPGTAATALRSLDAQEQHVVLTRGSSEQNPFGSTYLSGYDEGIVMEVMKNNHVPTIVFY